MDEPDDDGLERGDEIPYQPWWLTEEGTARMRAIEDELELITRPYRNLNNERD